MKIGDRVILSNHSKCELVEIDENRCKLKMIQHHSVSGTNVLMWVHISEVSLDVVYYRDFKLNELGIR